MFKELFTEDINSQMDKNNVYFDEDTSRWGIEPAVRKEGKSWGDLFAVFFTKENWKNGTASERWCFHDKSLKGYKPKAGYIVCRYVTIRSAMGGMAPVCAINPDNGKIQFLKDTNSDDKTFDRPLKVQYMRVSTKDL